jgi:uncharacterized membrane protein
MRNYIAVIFNDVGQAYKGLHTLWQLDSEALITVHGTTVVHRDDLGEFQVDTKETHPALATAVGVGVGALLGALAGPAGAAAGAAQGAGIGAAAGGALGIGADMARADTRDEATDRTALALNAGQSAVIADVSEESPSAIDSAMRDLGGVVRRRAWTTLHDDAWSGDAYLYPYEYVPAKYTL